MTPNSLQTVGFVAVVDVLGLTWLWAASAKIRDLSGFVSAVRDLLPRPLHPVVPAVAPVLPALEAITGLLLLTYRWALPALIVSPVLFGCFTIVLVRARMLGVRTTCACFGTHGRRPIDVLTITRTVLLLLFALVVLAIDLSGALRALHANVHQLAYGLLLAVLLMAIGSVLSAGIRLLTSVDGALR